MPSFDKPLSSLTEADLATLVADKAFESKTLDFKLQLPKSGNEDKKEFLYDASSFANSSGGYLIFGVQEKDGAATELTGVSAVNPDEEILRLEQLLRDGIRPSITGIEIVAVPLASGNFAIVVRIPKSWGGPHQVIFQKAFRFYARHSNGKYPVEVDELRSLFSATEVIGERIRNFRIDRTARINAGDTPVTLLDGGALAMHVIPFSAFAIGQNFPLQKAAEQPNKFPTLLDMFARQYQITFDGLLTTSNLEAPPKPQRAYTQVLRSGTVEAVASSIARGNDGRWLILHNLEAMIVRYARVYATALQSFGIEPPIAVLISLLRVRGMRLLQYFNSQAFPEDLPSTTLAADQFHFTEAVLHSVPRGDQETASQLKATLDHLANAAGLASSPNFDASGNYMLRIP